jgi:hypothetical protein
MIETQRYTTEEALRLAFKTDRYTIGNIANADINDVISVSVSFDVKVPAKYAKAILKDYINEQIHNP